MAPQAARRPVPDTPSDVPPHVKLFHDVRTRLEVERQVTFEESGRAFLAAQARMDDPETRIFVEEVMVEAVEIFLARIASNVNPALLFHFEDVLRSAAKIISWELRTLRSIKHLELLAKILDESCPFYQDKKAVLANRRVGFIRISIAKDLITDGTFALLLQMLKGQVPISEWSPADYTPPPGKPAPTALPLTARVISLLIVPAIHARMQEVDRVTFASLALEEANKNFTGETLKRQKAEELLELHALLAEVYGSQDENFYEFSLSLWLRCFESDAFALKKLGLENLVRVCSEASRNRLGKWGELSAGRATPEVLGNNNGVPSTSWDDTKVCAWLVEKKTLEILFGSGSQTHSALVGRSKNLLEHMAFAGAIGPAQIDMIFQSSVGQHESARGAVQSLLAELAMDLSSHHTQQQGIDTSIAILKRGTILASTRQEDMFFFARKLMQLENAARNRGIMISRNAELQSALLELLWSLLVVGSLSSSDEKESMQRRDKILTDFNDALSSAVVPIPSSYSQQKPGEKMNEDKIFAEFLSRSLSIIKPKNTDSVPYSEETFWAACAVLKNLIQLHHDVATAPNQEYSWSMSERNRVVAEWTKQTQTDFVEHLEKDYSLTQSIVHRITQLQDQTPKKLKSRLDFLRFVAERVRSCYCLDFEKLKICWNALSSIEEVRYSWFQDFVDPVKPQILEKEVISQFFTEVVCPSPSNSLGSPQGFDCFAAFFDEVNRKAIESMEDAGQTNLLGLETLWTLAIHASSGKVGAKASQILLAIQKRQEDYGKINGVDFVHRVMRELEQNKEDEKKRRCTKLLTSYFEAQVIPTPHAPNLTGNKRVLDLLIHHDDILTFSNLDIGKAIEKRFRERDSKPGDNKFGWYAGYIYHFDSQTNSHDIWFRDSEEKKYDMKTFAREGVSLDGANVSSERQYRMLSVSSEGRVPIQADSGKIMPQKVMQASKLYRGLRLLLPETTTISQVKTQMLEQFGVKTHDHVEESKYEIQMELDSVDTSLPDYFEKVTFGASTRTDRFRIKNNSLTVGQMIAKHGRKLYLSYDTSNLIPGPTPIVSNSKEFNNRKGAKETEVSPASFVSQENSPHLPNL